MLMLGTFPGWLCPCACDPTHPLQRRTRLHRPPALHCRRSDEPPQPHKASKKRSADNPTLDGYPRREAPYAHFHPTEQIGPPHMTSAKSENDAGIASGTFQATFMWTYNADTMLIPGTFRRCNAAVPPTPRAQRISERGCAGPLLFHVGALANFRHHPSREKQGNTRNAQEDGYVKTTRRMLTRAW